MAFLKVVNRAYSTLASGISDSDLSLTVATGEGTRFPSTFPFHLTVCVKGNPETNIEIVNCTGRTGDVFTIERAQEGTSAVSHSADELVELRNTAGVIENMQDELDTHNGEMLGLSIHNNTTLCKAYLAVKQSALSSNQYCNPRVMLDTVGIDIGSNFQLGDWYGADGAYRQADADSDATHIEDDDANFPAAIYGSRVLWASNALGTENTGVGYVLLASQGTDSDTLAIAKTSGADFAASYYYWIEKGYYVAPVSGWYDTSFQIYYDKCGVDKRKGVYIFINSVQTIASLMAISFYTKVRMPHVGFLHLAQNDILTLQGYLDGDTDATVDYLDGEFNTLMNIFLVRAD